MIPPQLAGERALFMRAYPPESDVDHPGKQPVGGTAEGPFYWASELEGWIEAGGNVGRALNDGLVALDIDADLLADLADDFLPKTLSVRTGSGGEHRYYHCRAWKTNRELAPGWGIGSIRSDRWFTIVPPSRHPNGRRYEILRNRRIATVEADDIAACLEEVPNPPDPASPSTTPESGRPIAALAQVNHDVRREELQAILRDRSASHSERVWLVGFLHGVADLSAAEIFAIIDGSNRWSNYDSETTRRQVQSVIRSGRGR